MNIHSDAAYPLQCWQLYAETIGALLTRTDATDQKGRILDMDAALALWRDATLEVRRREQEIVLIGNGASASMASHCAADIMKNCQVRTRVLTDLSMISALGNDEGYNKVYSLPLQWCMREGDMLVAVSSSGKSPNVLEAVNMARQKGALVVTLSAFEVDNPLRSLGHWNFYVGASNYGWAESCHAAILHRWMDIVVELAN